MTTTTTPRRPGTWTLDTLPTPTTTDRRPAPCVDHELSGATHVIIPVPAPTHPAGELVHPWVD